MPSKNQSILIGAAVGIVLGLIFGFIASTAGQVGSTLAGCGACLVSLIAPMVAVWHYTSTHNLTIPAGQGAGMGAAVGVVSAIVGGLLNQLLIAINILPDPITRAREQFEAQGMSAEQIEQSMGMVEMFSNPITGLIAGLVIGALVGAIGGAVGAAVFKKGTEDYEV